MKYPRLILTIVGFFLFFTTALFLFEPSYDPTGMFVYTPSLAIIDISNDVPINTILDVQFVTEGTKDLVIFSNSKFVELECNKQKIKPDSTTHAIVFNDYSCPYTSELSLNIIHKETNIDVQFGTDSQKAINVAP